ncbi:protein trichome birefringence-like 32 [Capsella rubella]|uniref:protein trichome birefringence-like 32 n=1 Tax=Capsella rubella TaxID=81985 RepID=UPI000CD5B3FD|nr:protein trichome birefringence-like 32 [Capsella rubella]
MESEDAYRMALKTMVRWVKKNMDPLKTRVFFATMSPTHYKNEGLAWSKTRDMEQQISIMSENNYVADSEIMAGGELFPALGESPTVHLHLPGYIRNERPQLHHPIALICCSLYVP